MATKKVNKATFIYGGEQLTLSKSKTQAAVRYTSGMQKPKRGKAEKTEQFRDFEVIDVKRGVDSKLDELRAKPEVSVGTHVWNTEGGNDVPFIPSGYLYVAFKPNTDNNQEQRILENLHLSVRERIDDDAYRVQVTAESPNPIKCAILLQRHKEVSIAEPEFITKPMVRAFSEPAGRFINTQWHLENAGIQIPVIDVPNTVFGSSQFRRGADAKVKETWSLLQGLGSKTLKIAVIDTGFDIEHPQLRGDGTKIRNTFNAANRSADVAPWFQASDGSWGIYSHGTSCAAVAAGAWDTQGILGACPNARIIPIKLDILSDDAIVKAFEHALLNGADIISCSLGFPNPVPLSTWVSNTIAKVAREGRGGLGTPIFIAAGNANPASNNQPRQISDFATHPNVMCITASNSLDEPSSYSFYGSNAFMSAPTNGNNGCGITTASVAVAGDGRSLEHVYVSDFGGTSSATPLAAGICGLLLTANPNLTVTQVRSIFQQTTDKIGSGYDANGRSPRLGYGRINAIKAVKMALGNAAPAGNTGGGTIVTPPPTTTTSMKGKVISNFLNVRSGPASTNPKVAELHQGDVVNLLEKSGGFWRIGQGQYVSADYIQVIATGSTTPVAPASRQGVIVNSPTVNVRSGPSTANAKVAVLKQGARVTIFQTSADGWHRIGTGQWVIGRYIQEV